MFVFDTESDGLLHEKVEVYNHGNLPPDLGNARLYTYEWGHKLVYPPATKFHIFGWTTDGKQVHTTDDPSVFLESLGKSPYAACHNAFTHDFPLLKKLLGYDYKGTQIDTLWLSWYSDPDRPKHGLESYEAEFGIQKTKVSQEQWQDGDYELMRERVTNDVLLNWKVFKKHEETLLELYQ